MAETTQASDMGTGLSLLLGAIVVLAAIATATSAYLSAVGDHGGTMQLFSGVFLAVALLAGAIAVAAVHLFE